MTTLTDRYTYAVTRSLPEAQRAEIERELRASISDSVEARVEAGATPESAERDALIELGDPNRLAASYADRPSFLLGPLYYYDYLRLLKLLLAIVLPCTAFGLALAGVLAGDGVGKIIGSIVAVTISAGVHIAFWTTLLFVILERTSLERRKPLIEWTPDYLPELPAPKQSGIGELIGTVIFVVLFVGAVIWQQGFSIVSDESGPIPVVNPALWSFWLPYFFVLAALEIVFFFAIYRMGRWTLPLAVTNVALGLAFAVPAAWLFATDAVINYPFFDAMGWDGPVPSILRTVGIAMIVVFTVWDAVDGFVKVNRARKC